MRGNVRVLENKQVYHILVDFWVLENTAVFRELTLVDEHHLVVGIRFEKLHN